MLVDLALAAGRLEALLAELRSLAPHSRALVLSDHDDARADAAALAAGAADVVHKATLAADLGGAVERALANLPGPPPGAR